jgi:hypothetical protein
MTISKAVFVATLLCLPVSAVAVAPSGPGLMRHEMDVELVEKNGEMEKDQTDVTPADLERAESSLRDKYGDSSALFFAMYASMVNLTSVTHGVALWDSGLKTNDGQEPYGSKGHDEAAVLSKVQGFFAALHEELERAAKTGLMTGDKIQKYATKCQPNDIDVVKWCFQAAMCLVQRSVATNGAITMEGYALLQELSGRFATIGWDNILMNAFAREEQKVVGQVSQDKYVNPEDFLCEGVSAQLALAQIESEASSSLAEAYRTTASLEQAAKTTHAILDAHSHNSSVTDTLDALHQAWEPACQLMGCDHTNYLDLFGASHSHSSALLELGASADHMHVQIRTRLTLENRMQRFLGEHGATFAVHMYRTQGTSSNAQVEKYYTKIRSSFVRFLQDMPKTQSVTGNWLDMVDRNHAAKIFEKQGKTDVYDHILELRQKYAACKHEDDEACAQNVASLVEQKSESRLDRSLSRKAVVHFVVSVVEAVVDFVVSAFECLGWPQPMINMGYGDKVSLGTPITGVGFSLGMGVQSGSASGLQALFDKTPSISLKLFMSVVFGIIPPVAHIGGLRTGLGIQGTIEIQPSNCIVAISVGFVLSGLWPTIPDATGKCVAGSWLAGIWRCQTSGGFVVTAGCCMWDIITGASGCGDVQDDQGQAQAPTAEEAQELERWQMVGANSHPRVSTAANSGCTNSYPGTGNEQAYCARLCGADPTCHAFWVYSKSYHIPGRCCMKATYQAANAARSNWVNSNGHFYAEVNINVDGSNWLERSLVANEGTNLEGLTPFPGIAACKEACSENPQCNSFAACPHSGGNGCWLKTAVITASQAASTNSHNNNVRQCRTWYKAPHTYTEESTRGYCLPWGSSGGDLCRPPVTAARSDTCNNVNSWYYHTMSEAEAKTFCDRDTACVGYTRAPSGRIKLKSILSSVRSHSRYRCYRKD